jgi:hypothetical protein
MNRKYFEHNRVHGTSAIALVCVGGVAGSVVCMRNVNVVTTNPLDFAGLIRSMAACIYGAVIGARTASVMLTGRWWRVIEPHEDHGSV